MSIDYSTYIGPYVECRFENKNDIEKRRCCPNKDCKEYSKKTYDNKHKFCDQCGTKITIIEFPIIVEAVNDYDLRMEMDEALHTPMGDSLHFWQKENNIHVWMPNQFLECDEFPRVKIDHHESSIQEIPLGMPLGQIETFKRQFEKELALLAQKYGEANMTYKWGVIHQVH